MEEGIAVLWHTALTAVLHIFSIYIALAFCFLGKVLYTANTATATTPTMAKHRPMIHCIMLRTTCSDDEAPAF
jgi:hypothetical protein